MDLLELALALFLVAQIVRMLVFAVPLRYPDIIEMLGLLVVGLAVGVSDTDFANEYDLLEGAAAAGLALFLLELYVVTLKQSAITISRNRNR